MSNFILRLRKMESRLNVCLRLKTVLQASTKAEGVDNREVLAYCEKHSKDSVELEDLCKMLFFTI